MFFQFLHFNDDRKNHGSTFCLFEQKCSQFVADRVFDIVGICLRSWIMVCHEGSHFFACCLNQILMFFHEDKTTAHNIRRSDQRTCTTIHLNNHHHHSIVSENFSITQHN